LMHQLDAAKSYYYDDIGDVIVVITLACHLQNMFRARDMFWALLAQACISACNALIHA